MSAAYRHRQAQKVPDSQPTYLNPYGLGTSYCIPGKGLPVGRRPVGLLALGYPGRTLHEVAGHGADGDSVPLALTGPVVDPANVRGLPGGEAVGADTTGRLPSPRVRSNLFQFKIVLRL
jgi:hypothetical protein